MPANEFEKKIQQTLDELKLKPSEEIWPMVAMRIRKDKRRRRGLIWAGLMVLLLGGAGYWWSESHSRYHGSSLTADHSNQKEIANPRANPISDLEKSTKPDEENKSAHALNSPSHNGEPEPKHIMAPSEKEAGKSDPGINKGNYQDNIKNRAPIPLAARHDPFAKVWNSYKPANNKAHDIEGKRRANEKEAKGRNIADQQINKNPFENALVFKPQMVTNNVKVYAEPMPSNSVAAPSGAHRMPQSLVTTAIPPKKDKIKGKRKWSFGISGRIGSSDVMTRTNSSRLNTASPNYFASYAPSGGRFLGDSVYRGASLSWGLGVYVKLHLNKRFALRSGLDYNQYDFKTLVGNHVNSTVQILNGFTYMTLNSFYAAGATKEYQNHFQYLELPLSVEWQLNKGQKIPLKFDAGLALGWLLNSNYLHRDYASNVLFKDNTLLTKMPISLNAGFTVALFNQSKYPVSLGPLLQYMVSDLQKNSGGLKQHPWFVGLKASLALWEFGTVQRPGNK